MDMVIRCRARTVVYIRSYVRSWLVCRSFKQDIDKNICTLTMSSVGHRHTAIRTRAAGTCPVSRTAQPPAGTTQTARESDPRTVYGTDPRRTLQHKAGIARTRRYHGARQADGGRLPPWSISLGCSPPLRRQQLHCTHRLGEIRGSLQPRRWLHRW